MYSSPLLRKLSGTSPVKMSCFCLLPPLPLEFSFSLVFFHRLRFFVSCTMESRRSTCLSFLFTTTASCPFVVSLILVCFCALSTTHSLPFFSAFWAHLTTAPHSLRRVFCQPFPMYSSTSDSMSWYLYLREPLWHVLTTICPSADDTCSDSLISEIDARKCHVSCGCDVSQPFGEIFPLHPLIVICYFPPSQLFPYHVCWSDVSVPLIVGVEVYESICDRFGWTFGLDIFSRHANLCNRHYHGSGLLELCYILSFLFYLYLLSRRTFLLSC